MGGCGPTRGAGEGEGGWGGDMSSEMNNISKYYLAMIWYEFYHNKI